MYLSKRRLTVAYTAQQNGTAERRNRTFLDMARYMPIDSRLPTYFWTEAISTACYIRNRFCSIDWKTTEHEIFLKFVVVENMF